MNINVSLSLSLMVSATANVNFGMNRNTFSRRVPEYSFPKDGIHEFEEKDSVALFWCRSDRMV
jgi:hypothetical protein